MLIYALREISSQSYMLTKHGLLDPQLLDQLPATMSSESATLADV